MDGDLIADMFSTIMDTGEQKPKWETPGDLAKLLNPKTVRTEALDLIDRELIRAFNTPDARLIISVPPQEGKSTRCGVFFPLWVLTQKPTTRIVMTSFSDRLAKRNSRDVRNYIISDGAKLGLTMSHDKANQAEWELAKDRGGMYAVSVGGALTGTPADMLIIDDPHKGAKEADSQLQREDVWEWWTSTASTRLAPGAPVILILTRWHENDLAGMFTQGEDGHLWRVVNIPAIADHNPEKGETDALGREPGQTLNSARGKRDWAAIARRVGSRVWNALYQGRPSASEGNLFKRAYWMRYSTPMWTAHDDGTCTIPTGDGSLVMSWDMTFKDTKGSDYVVGQVWLHRGPNAYLLDQVRRRMTFTETVKAVEAMAAKWPQCVVKLVEDKANGTAVLDVLKAKLPGFIPVTPHESKEARASAVTPFVEAKNVWLPEAKLAPWAETLIEEAASFPNGAHDDQVDAMTQALNRIFVAGGRAAGWLDFLRQQTGATK
ncbi:terminase [Arthrobacter phage Mufasa8]|uniref:Terminase n=1 Tax=Arthrobacter phage Mufasa8 TaxID=2656526 RepID=A0A649VND2_9CAUD|nr:terminase large subunit [Arthrobacter phage Mufasa8]QGJ93452.1 terminase [Arthrobacter phage Mufasa8]